jgi:hypothetical protein
MILIAAMRDAVIDPFGRWAYLCPIMYKQVNRVDTLPHAPHFRPILLIRAESLVRRPATQPTRASATLAAWGEYSG